MVRSHDYDLVVLDSHSINFNLGRSKRHIPFNCCGSPWLVHHSYRVVPCHSSTLALSNFYVIKLKNLLLESDIFLKGFILSQSNLISTCTEILS